MHYRAKQWETDTKRKSWKPRASIFSINTCFKGKCHIILIIFNFYIGQTFPLHNPSKRKKKYQKTQMTFCFFPDACSPLRMLASMASMSFTTKPKSLSQKLNTSWGRFEEWNRESKNCQIVREQKWTGRLSGRVRVRDLLGDGEGLVVELLDELGGHLVRVVGGRVGALLLQEVDFDGHGTDALLGLVKVVVGHWKWTHGGHHLEMLASEQMTWT